MATKVPREQRQQDFNDWLQHGLSHGYISQPYCDVHDGVPITPAEGREFDKGWDPCIHSVRLFPEKKPAKLSGGREGW